jgi:hypothetical protein
MNCNNDSNNTLREKHDINIYRYKFNAKFTAKLYEFSKIHQYDDREKFKESWIQWKKDNDMEIKNECERLLSLEYKGDILEKMYKSARYYFRKKTTAKKEPKCRSKYTNLSPQLLQEMDRYILSNKNLKPKTGFIEFCNDNNVLLKESINELLNNGITDSCFIETKIKKTYKNRYFILINK